MRLLSEAELIAELIELRLPQESPTLSPQGLRAVSLETLLGVRLRKPLMVELYAPDLTWLSGIEGSQTYHEISDISTLNKPTQFYHFSNGVQSFLIKRLFEPGLHRLRSRNL